MSIQKRNSEMVDLLRADFVHKLDTLWRYGPQVQTTVALGESFIVLSGRQYIVADHFEVIGTIDVIGELVII